MQTDPRGGTALLEIDWQPWVVGLGHDASAVARAREVRAAARARGWAVVCGRYLSTDPGDPLRSDPDGPGACFVAGLGPLPGDAVVTKHGRDVFDVADVDRVLERLGTRRLMMTGLLTDHGVALSARSALARGLVVTVVADACAGTDEAAHDEALAGLRAAGAQITRAAELGATTPTVPTSTVPTLTVPTLTVPTLTVPTPTVPTPTVPTSTVPTPTVPTPTTGTLTIARVAERTGLSKDTLRWYEDQGLIPSVGRDENGYRAYDEATVRVIDLVIKLRRTGMPVKEMASFVAMIQSGAGTHGRRLSLLEDHRGRVLADLAQLREDLEAIDAKITHYRRLVDEGRDCADEPVTDPDLRAQQRSRT
jgi:DNA-binding transcriptional MerR regulator/nicotinamidase-related amidase